MDMRIGKGAFVLTHEIMIAREIAEKVTRAAEKAEREERRRVELEVGDLAFFDTAALEMWLRQALAERPRARTPPSTSTPSNRR